MGRTATACPGQHQCGRDQQTGGHRRAPDGQPGAKPGQSDRPQRSVVEPPEHQPSRGERKEDAGIVKDVLRGAVTDPQGGEEKEESAGGSRDYRLEEISGSHPEDRRGHHRQGRVDYPEKAHVESEDRYQSSLDITEQSAPIVLSQEHQHRMTLAGPQRHDHAGCLVAVWDHEGRMGKKSPQGEAAPEESQEDDRVRTYPLSGSRVGRPESAAAIGPIGPARICAWRDREGLSHWFEVSRTGSRRRFARESRAREVGGYLWSRSSLSPSSRKARPL